MKQNFFKEEQNNLHGKNNTLRKKHTHRMNNTLRKEPFQENLHYEQAFTTCKLHCDPIQLIVQLENILYIYTEKVSDTFSTPQKN